VVFNNLRIPATDNDWPNLLDLDFGPPRLAKVEQLLELMSDAEAHGIQYPVACAPR
jgi:hypothetical protein